MKVGVIGLGAMGGAMAEQLVRRGHEVVAWNRSPEPAAALARKGATRAQALEQAFGGQAAITMLANDAAVRAVILRADVLKAAPKDFVHVVAATISVELARELEEVHAQAGVRLVCAPVLGRPDLAQKGELNVVAAGSDGAIAQVQPLLDAIGKKTWRVGDEPHKANVVKICVNFLLASAIEALGETLCLAEAQAVDSACLLEILTNTLFAAPAYKTYGGFIAARKFTPAAFKATHGLKDVKLALAASEAAGVPLPMGALLRDHFIEILAQGGADLDWAALGHIAFRHAGRQ